MKIVYQESKSLCCQQACIAMLASKTLADVIAVVGEKRLGEIERRQAFGHFNIKFEEWEYLVEPIGNQSLGALAKKHETMWLGVSDYLDVQYAHAVILHGGLLYDPWDGVNPSWPWSRYIVRARPVTVFPERNVAMTTAEEKVIEEASKICRKRGHGNYSDPCSDSFKTIAVSLQSDLDTLKAEKEKALQVTMEQYIHDLGMEPSDELALKWFQTRCHYLQERYDTLTARMKEIGEIIENARVIRGEVPQLTSAQISRIHSLATGGEEMGEKERGLFPPIFPNTSAPKKGGENHA